MQRFVLPLFISCAFLLLSGSYAQEEPRWDFMTFQEMGVDRFRADFPEFDGNGVVLAIMDTGVDMGVEGLKTLPSGDVKVVEARDFTGEGDLFWEEGHIIPAGETGEKLVDSEGRGLKGFREAAGDDDPERYYLAFIEEKNFEETSVHDLNGDGDTKDTFGILIFVVQNEAKPKEAESEAENADADSETKTDAEEEAAAEAEKKEEKQGIRYEAIVDVNGDGDLEDGVRVSDYYREFDTFVLQGKEGDRRKLTMSLNFHPEEKRLSVHFDDGGHGTHVAGITAGYRIHGQEGYHGMAPGARVMSLKIGNNKYAGGSTVTESVKKALDFGVKYAREKQVPVVFNMSYGIGSELESKHAIDQYVNKILWENPNVVFVTSAGNEGPGLSSVGTPATSVRAIAVGALLGPDAAAAQYGCTLEKEVAFPFSSRGGDTFKPDIMAPGSASSTVPLWGDNDHMHGTSMASPAAAGTIALLVDGLVRHDPPYEIDNALILRALKNTGRHMEGWTLCDEGGGVLDLPAAYAYAKFLCERGEHKLVREYRIKNTGPAAGFGAAYWRTNPALPRPTDTMGFTVEAGFAEGITQEEKARFYRAFDLTPNVDWLSLTRPMEYLKAGNSFSVGVMADLTGKEPGLYTGKIQATRKSEDRLFDAPINEFDLPITMIVPHRITPENRGSIQVTGEVDPGFVDRVFLEVPPGTTALALDLRMLEGGQASTLSARVYDPEGVDRGGVGRVTERGKTENRSTLRGMVPGTWEVVVSSSIRSRMPARYDLKMTLSGIDFAEPVPFAGEAGTTRKDLLLPIRCTQARDFSGTVAARIDGFLKREVIEVEDTDRFERTIELDNGTSTAMWTIEFDRETYALFTDCVLRIEDAETGDALRNTGLGQRSTSVSLTVPKGQSDPKKYKLILMPAFTEKEDYKKWHFVLTEKLALSSGPLKLDPVDPKNARVRLDPWDWKNLHFRLPATLPAVPDGYAMNMVLEASSGSPSEVVHRKNFEL
jgi:subtilisin family serine protease